MAFWDARFWQARFWQARFWFRGQPPRRIDLTWSDGTLPVAAWSSGPAPAPTWSAAVILSGGWSLTVATATWRPNATQSLTWSGDVAIEKNFGFFAGEDLVLTCSPDSSYTGSKDITGQTLRFRLVAAYRGTPPVTKTTGAGITITDATNGVFTVTLSRADTVDLEFRAYYYEVARIDAGHEAVLTRGVITLEPRP